MAQQKSYQCKTFLSVIRHFCVLLCWTVALEGGGGVWRSSGVLAQVGCDWKVDGKVINLKSMANDDGSARFKDVKGSSGSQPWLYSWNPCNTFSEGTCKNVAVCQSDESKRMYYNCGEMNTAKMGVKNGYLAIIYTSQTDIKRTSTFALICDEGASDPRLKALGDFSNGDYHFELTSKCACPDGCAEGLSVGTILVIIVLGVAVVYIIGGLVVNKAVRQKSGAELFPNVAFWKAAPGLVRDGFFFTFGICLGKRAGYQKH